jgi:hypothetical protein
MDNKTDLQNREIKQKKEFERSLKKLSNAKEQNQTTKTAFFFKND